MSPAHQCTPYPNRDEPGSLRFDPADLAKLVRPNTRLIVVNFPHNPTGFLPTHAEWEAVVATARGCGAFLFADEMYRYIELDAADRLTPAADAYERGVSLGGLSKNVGMPGLRIGWVACRDKQGARAGLLQVGAACIGALPVRYVMHGVRQEGSWM